MIALWEDHEGSLWTGTLGNGLYLLRMRAGAFEASRTLVRVR